jgi:predicted SnoaL-like aldol condensation-catalyzing enzyme
MRPVQKVLTIFIVTAVTGFSAAAMVDPPYRTKNASEATVVALLQQAFNQCKPAEAFDAYVGPYYRQHNPTVPDGKEAVIQGLQGFCSKSSEFHYAIKRVFSDGDHVIVHAHVTTGPKDRGMAVVDIFRLERKKVVEHWDVVQPVPEAAANRNTMF